ncbi:MarR family transcriptional regulator [Ktedonosporobacter rubrisoli]|uniref:MarR family transcriptional regulator n=1 Tax=Ktedonosporobacter rubrisoli TaxID=2509675 RepID=A0A4P6K1N4_KTERU|nr:MarR family transcriptional regulator [Ktedonosporobacter rubrisoli]QBD82088.1 MarR family transcriptional regulator [Ktedonosporobacter rubrisoli]
MSIEDKFTVEQEVYRLLTKTFYLLDDSDHRFCAEHGLNTRQFWTLQNLDQERGCSMVDLSRVLFTDKSNVTGIIDRLEHLKLVKRSSDPHDRRVILITLTPEGILLREKLKEEHSQLIHRLMGAVDCRRLCALQDHLRAISENIETYLEQGNTAPSST